MLSMFEITLGNWPPVCRQVPQRFPAERKEGKRKEMRMKASEGKAGKAS